MKLIWQNNNDLCLSSESLIDDFTNLSASWPLLSGLKRDALFRQKYYLLAELKQHKKV